MELQNHKLGGWQLVTKAFFWFWFQTIGVPALGMSTWCPQCIPGLQPSRCQVYRLSSCLQTVALWPTWSLWSLAWHSAAAPNRSNAFGQHLCNTSGSSKSSAAVVEARLKGSAVAAPEGICPTSDNGRTATATMLAFICQAITTLFSLTSGERHPGLLFVLLTVLGLINVDHIFYTTVEWTCFKWLVHLLLTDGHKLWKVKIKMV